MDYPHGEQSVPAPGFMASIPVVSKLTENGILA